jgi:hypothetical protein
VQNFDDVTLFTLERERITSGDFEQFGTGVMILKNIFSKKVGGKKAFFAQNTASFCKILIITLVCEKNANFFAENWQKSPKIVILTSTVYIHTLYLVALRSSTIRETHTANKTQTYLRM